MSPFQLDPILSGGGAGVKVSSTLSPVLISISDNRWCAGVCLWPGLQVRVPAPGPDEAPVLRGPRAGPGLQRRQGVRVEGQGDTSIAVHNEHNV